MATIKVRAKEGRKVYDKPRGGKIIPSDKFVEVQDSPYIQRLLNHWQDIEKEGEATPAAPAVPASPPEGSEPPTA